jgi:hypothetical protein
MKRCLALFLALASVLAFTPCFAHEEMSAPKVSASFDPLKALVGEWHEAGKGDQGTVVIYELVAGGSALVERMDPGTPHSMVTVYYPDGDKIMLTHFCADGNQPRMRGVSNAKSIKFTMIDVTNLPSPKSRHMDGLTLTFTDKDHLVQEWSLKEGDTATTHRFDLERKKAS